MEISEIKKIPIPDYLKECGVEPVKRAKGGYYVYRAFWRGGDGNHIWVNTKENLWHDKVSGNGVQSSIWFVRLNGVRSMMLALSWVGHRYQPITTFQRLKKLSMNQTLC